MKYVISDDLISLNFSGKTHLISKGANSYFDIIKDSLLKESSIKDSWLDFGESIREVTGGLFSWEGGQYYYDNESIPNSIGKRLNELIALNLPIQPLVNFWQKVREHPDKGMIDTFCTIAGCKDIPLSWEGDLIMYTRASWVKRSLKPIGFKYEEVEAWSSNFEPGKVVKGLNLKVGSFGWANGQCPDAGNLYDVQVNPVHVIQTSINPIIVSEFKYISHVREHSNAPEKVCFIETQTNSLGEQLIVRQPYSAESLKAYLISTVPGANKIPEKQVEVVPVRGGC